MSAPLVKGPGFGREVGHTIDLKIPKSMIGVCLTVVILKDGRISLQGPIPTKAMEPKMIEECTAFCRQILELGQDKLREYHAGLTGKPLVEESRDERETNP